ncbi:hypothetical protein NKI08_23090 [Mesorhizobium sp. M0768]
MGRIALGDRLRQARREVLHLWPLGARGEGRDDVHSFASRQHRESRKSQRFKDSAELKGSGADGLKIEAFIGVEVEHEAVGLFDIPIRFLPSALEA